MSMLRKVTAAGLAAGLLMGATATMASAADEIYIPNLAYRTGPFAATGTPVMNGQRDYIMMLNERDGGLNGAKLVYDECETGYNTDKGVECYEKTKGDAVVTQPWSTGITLQVLPRAPVDKVPVLAPGYGMSAGADGATFPWFFVPPATYWDAASVMMKYIGGDDLSSLKGKKLVLLHLDHPYGKEPIPFFEMMAEEHGFEFLPIPVGLKEMQNQSAQWLQIRRERPDWVMMWGWGAMNQGAINEAVKTRFPMDKFIGVWWSGSDDDLIPQGAAAKGYKALSYNNPGMYPVVADIKKHVVDKGNSLIAKEGDMNKVFYQRGIYISMLAVEAIKVAQDHFGKTVVNAEEVRWGLENLNLTAERLKELGAEGMAAPLQTSCANHSGNAGIWVTEWDGEKFVAASDAIEPMVDVLEPMYKQAAQAYADSNAPWTTQECK